MSTSKIVHLLETTREEVAAAVRAIPEAQANTRPSAGRWNAIECVEHIAAVEESLLGRLASAERLDAARVDPEKEANLVAMGANRTVRFEAPEPVAPKGRFTSLPQALDHFNATRERTIRFAEERSGDLYQLAAEHPRFGSLNGTEVMLILAAHARRHAEQIREIAGLLDRPRVDHAQVGHAGVLSK